MPRLLGLVGQPATSALSVPSESSASFPDPALVAGWRRNARCFPNIPRLGDHTWEGVAVAVPSGGAAPVLSRGPEPVGWVRWGPVWLLGVSGWTKRVCVRAGGETFGCWQSLP